MPGVSPTAAVRGVLVASLIGLAAGSGPAAPLPPAADKPSVIVIVLPHVGARLGCYGAAVKTPNADRLARMGRRFARAYAQYPAAEASRVSLMTGQRPEKTGVFEELRAPLEDAAPLQERFRAGGYRTVRVGPVFMGPVESAYAWDVAEEAPDGAAARRAASLVEANRERLFFMTIGLPDTPGTAGAPAGLPGPDAWGDVPAIAVSASRVDRPGRTTRVVPIAAEARRALLGAEDARVASLDAQLGVVLEALDRAQLWDRVTVVLVSDGGAYLGGHGDVLRKDLLFEETLRTSLIVSGAGVAEPGAATEGFAELVDVYPTLVELGGLKRARGLQGSSLVPLLRDPKALVKTAAFSVAARDAGYVGRSVRTDRYRYNEWPDGSEELYDHEKDANEWTNLAAHGAGRATTQEMRSLLDERDRTAAPPPAQPPPSRAGKKPNVLLIVLDDLTVHLGCYGYPVKTPNIDRLASLGRRFDRAYAQVAMCSPSRMSFMTGWRPERLNLWNNSTNPWDHAKGAVPLQEHFHAHGYYTARVGKIYHGKWNERSTWDLSESDIAPASPAPPATAEEARANAGFEADGDAEGDISRFWLATDNKDEDEPDGRRARRVATLLQEQRSQPFFVAVGFAKPHLRWVAPRKYFDMYSPDRIEAPPTPPGDADDIPAIAIANGPIDWPGLFLSGKQGDFDEAARRRALAAQYACVSFVDAQVGVVLDALDRSKLWDDTIVVLLGDHGYHLGEHGLWRKDTLFEEAARAPLIVVSPGDRKRGTATRSLAELLDLYPTLTDLAGLPRPAGLQGQSLVPLIDEPAGTGRDRKAVFTFRLAAAPRLGRSVRTDKYRFTEWPDGSRELYDLGADPGEGRNVVAEPLHAAAAADLKALLAKGFPAALAPVKAAAGGGR
jgi:iduronate 2-sulfatase